jgi:hypothetical protein
MLARYLILEDPRRLVIALKARLLQEYLFLLTSAR